MKGEFGVYLPAPSAVPCEGSFCKYFLCCGLISSIETKISSIILESVSYRVSLISWNLIFLIVFLLSGLKFNPFSSVYDALRFWNLKGAWQWRTAEWGGERNRLILKRLSRISASSKAGISNKNFNMFFCSLGKR